MGTILTHQDQRCRKKEREKEFHFGLNVGEGVLGSEFYNAHVLTYFKI